MGKGNTYIASFERVEKKYHLTKEQFKVFLKKTEKTITLDEAQNYLDGGGRPVKKSQIIREIDYFLEYYNPAPELFLAYDRLAYFGNDFI